MWFRGGGRRRLKEEIFGGLFETVVAPDSEAEGNEGVKGRVE